MFKTLSAMLAGAQALVFFALGVGFILATQQVSEGRRLLELVTSLGIGVAVFSSVTAIQKIEQQQRRNGRKHGHAYSQAGHQCE